MRSMASGKTKGRDFKARAFSNVQLELLKLYSTDLEDADLMELRKVLANFFAQKAMDSADSLWNQKEMSADTMENWLFDTKRQR